MLHDALQPVQTQDQTFTYFSPKFGEHYHNLHGALDEALGIYVQPTNLQQRLQQQPVLRVLDPFFGLGYNSLGLMAEFARLQPQFPDARLHIIAFEFDPEILEQIPNALQNSGLCHLLPFWKLFEHNTYYQTQLGYSEQLAEAGLKPMELGISAELFVGDIRRGVQQLSPDSIDIVYHDAFSPKAQPELWTQELFAQYKRVLNPQCGQVLTYSANSAVRNALHTLGFHLYQLSQLTHKPGTLASLAPLSNQVALDVKAQALLGSKSGIPYRDSETLDWPTQTIVDQRQAAFEASPLAGSSAVHRQFANTKD